ncbi:MAG TPA: protein kinase, partial [Armatimonadota bacterium]|nr:protein kinase [Armatimonadota bacterium]
MAGYHPRGGLCALKLAKAEIPDAAARLRREKQVLAQLRHPRVVALLDAGEHAGTPFLVLEWLEGETLLDLVQTRRRLALRQSLEISEAVADGLAAIHAHGLVHGDIRPQNILVVPRRCAVLTDPGGGEPGASTLPADDIRAVGGLLHLMLTGFPESDPPRLTAAAGYNRAVVQLWEQVRSDRPLTASDLLSQLRRLRQGL